MHRQGLATSNLGGVSGNWTGTASTLAEAWPVGSLPVRRFGGRRRNRLALAPVYSGKRSWCERDRTDSRLLAPPVPIPPGCGCGHGAGLAYVCQQTAALKKDQLAGWR